MYVKQYSRCALKLWQGLNFKSYNLFHSIKEKLFLSNNFSRILTSRFPLRDYKNTSRPTGYRFNHSASFCTYSQGVPRTIEEVEESLSKEALSPKDSHLLKISIIGVPNSGKSTITNQLIKWRVCSISPKVHTTIKNARAVHNDKNIQLVFLDTPGIVTSSEITKYKLRGSLVADPEVSLQNTDVIAVIHDASNKFTWKKLHPGILRLLALYPQKKSILILNKVDILKSKPKLLEVVRDLTGEKLRDSSLDIIKINAKSGNSNEMGEVKHDDIKLYSKDLKISENHVTELNKDHNLESNCIEVERSSEKEVCERLVPGSFNEEDVMSGNVKLTEDDVNKFIANKAGWTNFDEVFMVSALTGLGVNELRKYLTLSAYPSPWMFTGDTVTDQSPQEMTINTVREKCLKHLSNNIPYELQFGFLHWELSESEVLNILIDINCKMESRMKHLIGKAGETVKAIAQESEQELRDTFRTEVRLRLNIHSGDELKSKKLKTKTSLKKKR